MQELEESKYSVAEQVAQSVAVGPVHVVQEESQVAHTVSAVVVQALVSYSSVWQEVQATQELEESKYSVAEQVAQSVAVDPVQVVQDGSQGVQWASEVPVQETSTNSLDAQVRQA